MQFFTDNNVQFPLVELSLNQGETVYIQRGSMVYHIPNVTLNTKLNASGSGVGRFVKAVGRSMVSGESTFITQVFAQSNNAYLALAPDSPGQVVPLYLGEKQYRLNVPSLHWMVQLTIQWKPNRSVRLSLVVREDSSS